MRPITRAYNITSNLFPIGTPAGTKVSFPDIPELKTGVLVDGIELYTATQLAVAPTLQPNISAADTNKVVLCLQELSTQRVRDIPLFSLNPPVNGGIWKEFVPFVPNWQASYFLVTQTLAAAAAFVVCMSVFFRRNEDLERERQPLTAKPSGRGPLRNY